MRALKILGAFAAMAAILTGCGGGGGGGGSTGGGSVSVFATDSLSGYDAVWVKIQKISLTPAAGGEVVVFSNPAGTVVDLTTLRDGLGNRFRFMSRVSGVSGSYSAISVEFAPQLTLFPAGATIGQNRTFSSATVTRALSPNLTLSGESRLIVDFDLANWTDSGTQVTGVINVLNSDSVTNEARHNEAEYRGIVGGLSGAAPNQSFSMAIGGNTVNVRTSALTRIFADGGAPNPQLSNGQTVEVRGIFNLTTNVVSADSVRIRTSGGSDDVSFKGAASEIDSARAEFEMTVTEARNGIPVRQPVNIWTNVATVYLSNRGVPIGRTQFFSTLTNGTRAEAEGTYTTSDNRLLAKKLKLEDDEDQEAEVRGPGSNPNLAARTMRVRADRFFGLNVAPGSLINVEFRTSATFRGTNGATISIEEFYAQLPASSAVEVEGEWDSGASILRARKGQLEGIEDTGEARGIVFDIRDTTSFRLTVTEWENFPLVSGDQILVVPTDTAEFRDSAGNTVTRSAFFGLIVFPGTVVQADGNYNTATRTLTATRVRIR